MPRRLPRRRAVRGHARLLRDTELLRAQTAEIIADTKRIITRTCATNDKIRQRNGVEPPEAPIASAPMTGSRLPFAQIRRMLGAPQIQVEANGRVWRLHLVDSHHDNSAVELVFEHVATGLAAVRLRVDADHLTRDHVAALLRQHLTENPPATNITLG